MATISNTMAINDQMSPALNAIAAALSSCMAAFEQMQAASSQAINTANIQAANSALAQTETQASAAAQSITEGAAATQAATAAAAAQEAQQAEVTQEIRQANNALVQTERQQDDVNQSLREGSGAADQLWGKIKGFIAAYAGWHVVSQTVAWSDEMTNIRARLNNINDGQQTNKELMEAVYQASQRSHASFKATADVVGRLGSNAREAFDSTAEMVAFAEQLNKQFSVSGAGAVEAQAATIQLVQGLGSGVLRGDELNSVFEQAPSIIRTIAEYMDVPIGQIRTLASEGKITADIVKNAMLGAAEETNAKFAAMPTTFSGLWTMAKNTVQMNMLGLQKTLEKTFNSTRTQEMIQSATDAFGNFISVVEVGLKGVIATVGFLYDNWSLIAPVIGSVVAALLIYKGVMLGINAVEVISRGLKIAAVVWSYAKAAATGVEVAATQAATAAQMGLNAAMLASPVTWIIAAIIAVVGLLYLTVAVINKVTGESYSATGIIAGIIWSLWAYIKNVIAMVWNNLLSLAEFFINVWTNPVYSLKKLIYNLAETFAGFYMGVMKGLDPVITALAKGFLWAVNKGIQAINWLSEAMDAIDLGWGQMGEIKMEGTVASNAEAAYSSVLAKINPGAAPEGYVSLDKYKMDFADPAAYAAAGYNAGAKFADDPMGAIKDALGLQDNPAIRDLLNNQAKQIEQGKEIAKNTDTSSGEEDYTYLKQIMAGRAVDRLSGTDIKIQMNNSNRINSALDLDKIVDALAQKLTGAMDSAAEGVHY